MYTDEYDNFPYRYYRYVQDNGKSIFCKRLHLITFEEVKIEHEEYMNNRPSKLTLEKKIKQVNINLK